MSDLKTDLAQIQNQIKSYKTYSDESAKEYVDLLKNTHKSLKDFKENAKGRRLEKRLSTAIKALYIETKDRFDPYFYSMRDKKKQDELNYSKLVVLGVLKKLSRIL